jgi:Domain of unknown function (DUF1918)
MRAAVGDEVVVDTETLGVPRRRGRVLEVLVTGGAEHYRVAWADGRESLLFPGADVHIVHSAGSEQAAGQAAGGPAAGGPAAGGPRDERG